MKYPNCVKTTGAPGPAEDPPRERALVAAKEEVCVMAPSVRARAMGMGPGDSVILPDVTAGNFTGPVTAGGLECTTTRSYLL